MIRHGTRYPGKKWINTLISDLPKIRDSITEAHKQGKGSLRLEEAQNLLNWKITFGLKDMMNLAREGGRELVGIAERFQSRLPGVLPEIYNNETYSVFIFQLTIKKERTLVDSGNYFFNFSLNSRRPSELRKALRVFLWVYSARNRRRTFGIRNRITGILY